MSRFSMRNRTHIRRSVTERAKERKTAWTAYIRQQDPVFDQSKLVLTIEVLISIALSQASQSLQEVSKSMVGHHSAFNGVH
jgi:hypothetical protein